MSVFLGKLVFKAAKRIDCHAEREKSGGVRFRFKQSEKHKKYILFSNMQNVYEFFNRFMGSTVSLNTLAQFKSIGHLTKNLIILKKHISILVPFPHCSHQADATRSNKFFHTHVRSIKRIGPHNIDIISVIIGSLLGDARGNVRTINGTRFFFKQSDKHEKSLLYLYNFFYERGYVIKSGIRSYLVYNKVKGNKKLRILAFNTYTFRSLNWISDIFLKNGKIYLNPKVENYLTPLALTTWIIYRGKFLKELHLNTCFRSIEDIERLANILTNKYGIVCNIYKYNKFYGLSISNTSITAVMDLINLYMTYDLRKIFNEFLIALWLQRNYNNNNNTRIRFIINISHNRFFSTLGRRPPLQLCWRGGGAAPSMNNRLSAKLKLEFPGI